MRTLLPALILATLAMPAAGQVGCNENTGDNMTLAFSPDSVVTVAGRPLSTTDTLKVYTPRGDCRGGRTGGAGSFALPIWGDNIATPEVDGFLPGEPLRITITDSAGVEYDDLVALEIDDSCSICQAAPEYAGDALLVVTSADFAQVLSIENPIAQEEPHFEAYPNPSAEEIFILADRPGTIRIYDAIGSEVRHFEVLPGSLYAVRLQTSGLYFVRMGNRTRPVVKI